MEKERKYRHWGWWALVGLVAILILIGLIIAAVATKNTDKMPDVATDETVQVVEEENKEAVKDEAKENKKQEETKKKEEKESDKKKSTSSTKKKSNKKEEPAVVTRCKSKAYMEKTLRGHTDIDCSTAAGIEAYKKLVEGGSSASGGTTTTPDSSAGPEVYEDATQMPKSGPENLVPIFVLLAGSVVFGASVLAGSKKEYRSSPIKK